MISRWRFAVRRFVEQIWVIAAAYALLAALTPLAASALAPLVPDAWAGRFGAEAALTVLNILATSLLAVVTFSVGVMVQALFSATAAVTPRATALLRADSTTQRTLSTFLGAFLFSLISIIALKANAFSEKAAIVLFALTILVVAIVALTILRWIAHLTVFGLMADTIRKVERAASDALAARLAAPFLGGAPWSVQMPDGAKPVYAGVVGYVCNVDVERLQALAESHDGHVYLAATPGSFVHKAQPLVHVSGAGIDPDAIAQAFSIGPLRSFDQDPRFALAVLTEIAERALSPGVNDPGTAIDILGRVTRVLAEWRTEDRSHTPRCSRVFVPPLQASDLLDDVFPAIARDAAGNFAVQLRLQKMLLALARMRPAEFSAPAQRQSREALERCLDALLPDEKVRLVAVADQIGDVRP